MTEATSPLRAATIIRGHALGPTRLMIVLAIMATTNMLNAMDRQIFPILLPQIQGHYGFSIEAAGLLSTIFTLGIGLAGIPAGIIADRFDRKLVIVTSIGIFSVATGLQATAVSFADMFVYRVLTGIGEGIQNAALFAVAGAFFHHRRTMALGVLTGAYGLGAALSPVFGASIMDITGHWQTPLIALALFGVVVMLLWNFVPRSVTQTGTIGDGASPVAHDQPSLVERSRLSTRNVVRLCAIAAVTGVMIYGYLGLYPTYLISVRDFSTREAAIVMSSFGIGGISAIPLGMLADRWNQKWLNVIALSGFMVVGSSIFIVVSDAFAIQLILSFLMGMLFTGIVYPNSMSLLQKNMPASRGGFATGLFVAMLYIPSSISGYLIAFLATKFGWQVAGASTMVALAAVSLIVMFTYRPSDQLFR
ncbi:MAG: MFS transporter [Rhodococcus sp. (in: high G+C Gram-positive bacteria)]|uniref:MFS transporter n=1 Tax=Rhodococcus sp. TaxID=1831 RepID=UPI003BB505BB